jgi:hypothetical protein
VGDVSVVEADRLLAFERHTDHALETAPLFVNPASAAAAAASASAESWAPALPAKALHRPVASVDSD